MWLEHVSGEGKWVGEDSGRGLCRLVQGKGVTCDGYALVQCS